MRILFVTSTYPEDIQMATHGIHQRMQMFLDALGSIAELDILFYVGPDIDISPARAIRMEELLLKHWCCNAKVFLCHRSGKFSVRIPPRIPFHERLREWWVIHPHFYAISNNDHVEALGRCLKRNPDAVFVHRINPILPVLSKRKIVPPVFFDLDDIEHRLLVRSVRQPPLWRSKFLQYLKVPSLIWLERRAITLACKTFVCSETDRHYLTRTWHLPRVTTIPNAVAIPPLHELPAHPVCLLVGNFSYGANVIAAEYLVKRIWPIIKGEIPEARLVIAGKNPGNIQCSQGNHDGVEFRGFVDNLAVLYHESRVVCCPILSGSGTRVKIIEAAAHGKAIVSTSLGAEGLDFLDGKEIILRDDPELFAQACIELMKNTLLCQEIGDAARSKAAMLHDRNDIMVKIQSEISAVFRTPDLEHSTLQN